VSLRSFYAFDQLRRHLGTSRAAQLVFGEDAALSVLRRVGDCRDRVRALVHPELVTGREDGFVSAAWTVKPGSTRRGEASCNLTERILEIPLAMTRRHASCGPRTDARASEPPRDPNTTARSMMCHRQLLECAEETSHQHVIAA